MNFTIRHLTLAAAVGAMALLAPQMRAQATDIVATALEVTQGNQDLNNSVRLVSQRYAFVRFHVQTAADGATATATATLTATNDGGDSVTLAPLNANGTVDIVSAPDRVVLAQAFLFRLPDGYRQGTVTLRAEVNPDKAVNEPDYSNNVATATVTFEDVPPLNLVIYSIGYTAADGTYYINDDSHVKLMLSWMSRTWPVSSFRYWLRHEDITKSVGQGLPDCKEVNAFMAAKRMTDLQSPNPSIPANARYYGMVDDRGGYMRGCADDLPGFNSSGPTGPGGPGANTGVWDTDGSYGDWYGSHEVAHNFGRSHAEFCSASGGAPYPYPQAHIGPGNSGPDAIFGFDLQGPRVLSGLWTDNMAYCDYQWMGKFTYHGLMDALQENIGSSVAEMRRSALAADPNAQQDRLMVVGGLDVTKTPAVAEMSPFFVLKGAFEVQPRKPGSYNIVLKKGDQELARYPFTPRVMVSGVSKNPGDPELNFLAVQELVPYVDGTTGVDITGPGNALLYSVKAGPAFPQVQITSPAGGESLDGDAINLAWTATDADGDTMYFTVLYSADGGVNWETVEENLTAQSTSIDRIDLQASTSAMFRVLATDGIHTTVATSKPFKLAARKPTVSIGSPPAGSAYVKGQTVAFSVDAYDPDAGESTDQNIAWSSSIDGALGTGANLAVTKLSVGNHTVTVTVKDAGGLPPVTSTTTFAVVAKTADLPVVANRLVVQPDTILLDPSVQASELLDILNANTKQSLNWTATTDQPWVKLDKTSGKTPAVVTVSLGDISALPAGASTANITVNTSDGQKATLPVQVRK